MADPKFANLPGIAYDQPDVYETPDVPEDTTTNNFDDYEVEGIERLHISTDDSSNKFKGKYLTGHIDYSHDDVRGGCWELAAHGEKETPIEKYRRIKCEMDELLNGIVDSNANATVSKKYKDNYEAISGTVNSAQKVLGSLRLENVLGTETNSSTSDHEIRKLIEQVEGFQKKSNTVTPSVRVSDQMPNTKRISELEARLHRLETIIGTTQPDKPNRLVSALDTSFTLLDSVQQVSTKAALLQPAQLDQLEERVSALSNKLDTINEKASILSGKKCASDEKITALYEIAKRTEPIAKILPDILLRMKALEMLHNHANAFSKTIDELEETQSALVSTLNGNKEQLQNVQEAFALNLENVNQEVGQLESRLKTTEKR